VKYNWLDIYPGAQIPKYQIVLLSHCVAGFVFHVRFFFLMLAVTNVFEKSLSLRRQIHIEEISER